MCTKEQLQVICKSVLGLALHEFADALNNVILYGSYARGDHDEQSDIDIMVRVNMDKAELKRHKPVFTKLASDLDLEYGVFVSIHLQDEQTFEQYKDALPFYRNVEREGVRISA